MSDLSCSYARSTIFLLTKPPDSERTMLCLKLIERSENPVLYIAGDGVYNLISNSIDIPPCDRVYACREDMEARGVPTGDAAILPDDFYEQFMKDIMLSSHRLYAF